MPYPAKTFYAVGLMLKEEGSYLGGGSLSVSTDAIQLALENRAIPFAYQEDFDGVKSYDLAARSPLPGLLPSARFLAGAELPFHWKGNTAAYDANTKPALHVPYKLCGLEAAFSATPTPQWTYTPYSGAAAPTSGVGRLYSGAEKVDLTGVFGTLRIVAERGKPVQHLVRVWGLMGDVSDDLGGAEALTLVYPTLSLDPVKADAITVVLGTFLTADVQRVEFELGWGDPVARQLATAAGAHAGFARDLTFNPRLKLQLEKTALVGAPYHTSAGFDGYQLRKAAQKITGSTVSVQFGSAQYNRQKLTFAQAQVVAPVVQEENGPVSMVTLELKPYASTPVANDALSILAN